MLIAECGINITYSYSKNSVIVKEKNAARLCPVARDCGAASRHPSSVAAYCGGWTKAPLDRSTSSRLGAGRHRGKAVNRSIGEEA
jgi:hypothetical protein